MGHFQGSFMTQEKGSLAANVEFNDASLRASVDDNRSETREIFAGLSGEERNALSADAWTIGLQTLFTVGREAREAAEPRTPIRLSSMPPGRW
jgi:hypothetical protein